MIARVPASSANLGPGFDTLALALSLYIEINAELSDRFSVATSGFGAELDSIDGHLGAKVAMEVLGHSNVHLEVRSQIPLGRGLGSSAAFVAACAAALGSDQPFEIASKFDGHPENAAASVFGGLVTATRIGDEYVSNRLPLDSRLSTIVVIPPTELKTKSARGVLPSTVPFADATFNLGRVGLLIAGMANIDNLRKEATEDRLHQDFRSSLFPQSKVILDILESAGAVCASWSGAGPTMIGFCAGHFVLDVLHEVERSIELFNSGYKVLEIIPDHGGLVHAMSYGPDFQPLKVASL